MRLIIGQPAVFFRKEIFERAGRLDIHYHCMLDHQLWLRMAELAPIHYVPELWAAARFHAAAKNIAQAPEFGKEAYEVADWMRGQPTLADLYQSDRAKISPAFTASMADICPKGGLSKKSLQCYARSFLAYPPVAVQDWKRIVFTVFSMFGFTQIAPMYRRYQLRQSTKYPN